MKELSGRRLVVAGVIAFAVLRLVGLTRYPLWTDETWTLETTFTGFRAMLRLAADDQTHPPLFYAVLWFWRRIGPDALAWQRLLPAIAGIATAIPLVALARRAGFSTRATLLGALVGAGSGMLVGYSAELRNYAFVAFFATVSLALWLRERDSEQPRFALLTLVNVLLVYSHFFGVLIVAAEVADAAMGARLRLRAMLRSAALAALSLLPWAAETIRRSRVTGGRLEQVSWIPIPTAGDLLDVVRESLGGIPMPAWDIALAAGIVLLIACWLLRERGTERWRGVRLIMFAVIVPVGAAWIVSVAGSQSVWVTRYLIIVAPPLALLLAGAIDWAMPKRTTVIAVSLALVPGALTTWNLARGTAKPRYDLVMNAILAREASAPADVYTLQSVESFPVLYLARAMAQDAGREVVRTTDLAFGAQIPTGRGWLIWEEVHPPRRPVSPPAMLIRQGFTLGEELRFASQGDVLRAVRFERKARR